MTRGMGWCVFLLTAASVSAQPPTVSQGDIRCPDCALTGQAPAAAGFDASQVEFVASPIPAIHDNETFRIQIIARVVHAAPLVVEVLDSEYQTLDRNLKVVPQQRSDANDPGGCQGPHRIEAVDLASKPVVSTLKLNDIVTGGDHHEARRADARRDPGRYSRADERAQG